MIRLNSVSDFYLAEDSLKVHTTIELNKYDQKDYENDKEAIPSEAKVFKERIDTTLTKDFATGKESSKVTCHRYYFHTPALELSINGKNTRLEYEGPEAFEKRDQDYKTLTGIMENPAKT